MAKDTGQFWDTEKVVGQLQKNDKGDQIVVKLVTRGQSKYVDVRTYYVDKTTGLTMPGKGIAIPDDLADEVANIILESGGRSE